jgi:cytochrome d ubiquinol oxidase subunit II
VLNAIGPYWDGNEVWLIATGTTLFAIFPRVLAAGLSGFYFAIFLLLWCLILRGAAIEFRSHVEEPLWRRFLGRGVVRIERAARALLRRRARQSDPRLPIDDRGWFGLALFTDWSARPPVGILDWYTLATGLFALGHSRSTARTDWPSAPTARCKREAADSRCRCRSPSPSHGL